MQDVQLNGQTLTTTSATTAPSAGTSETWTVTALASGVPALSTGQCYALIDITDGRSSNQAAEIIRITAADGPGDTSITVTRGADGTTPIAHSNPAIFAIVVVASHLVKPPTPSYAPLGLKGTWNGGKSSYNGGGAAQHKMRGKIAGVAFNSASLHLAYLTDSTGVGFDGTTYTKTKSIPYRLGRAISRLTGNPYYTTGLGFAAASTAAVGDIWTTTGSWASGSGCMVSFSAGTATLVTTEMCTNVDIFLADNSPNFSYTVDGGSTVNVTVGGTATLKKLISLSGLTYGFHTIVLTVSSLTSIAGQRWWTPSLNQVHVHRLAYGGATANSGAFGVNFSNTTNSGGNAGLGWVTQQLISASGLTFDIAVIEIGSNDIFASAGNASSVAAGIETMLGFVGSAVPVLVHEIPVPSTDATAAATVGTTYFTEADLHSCLMLDWNDYVNNPDGSYVSDGQAGSDGVHPIYAHQNMIATWIAEELCQHQSVGEIFAAAGVIGLSGGRFKIIEQSGTWPLRPPVPAGYVDYEGPDATIADMLDGDSWDDT